MRGIKIKKIIIFLLICVLSIVLSPPSFALEIKRNVLPNGLIVLHVERHNLPLVMVSLLIKASPLNEPEEKAGLANLTSGLLTEGTKTRTAAQISEEIEFIGASLSSGASYDYTTISMSVLKKDAAKGFEIFSDVLLNPTFPEEEISRLKDQIKGSLRQAEEEPSFLLSRAFRKELYRDHPYGRLIQGSPDTLDAVQRTDIAQFHSTYFVPNNAILSIVGDVKEDELKDIIDKFLSRWDKRDVPMSLHKIISAPAKKVVKIDKDLTQANILIGHLGITRDNPDYYALSVMNYILGGGGFSSRLMQSIRDEMGLAYDVHSFFAPNKEIGLFQAGVQTKNESANTVIDEILDEIKRIRHKQVSASELADAKAYLMNSFGGRIDTMRKIADFLSVVEFYVLGIDYIDKYPTYINAVTGEDILRVAKKYLDPENYILVVVGNQEKANIRQTGDIRK